MKRIYKYPLDILGKQSISVHEGSKILTVQAQWDIPCLWIEVDDTKPVKDIEIVTFGTGHSVIEDKPIQYIGSYQLGGGNFVGHVYEVIL
jgi:hypothetical protein